MERGAQLGPYEIVALLGAGGMGEVYRARDQRLGRTVAIKILPPASASDSVRKARFEREARAISRLNHPHICTLYDVGESKVGDEVVHYLVMEHLEGETLERRLARGPLPIREVLQFGIEIADALHKAHRERIIHRDLKPSNIMLTESGTKVLDFGLAKHVDPASQVPIASGDSAHSSETDTAAMPITSEGRGPGTFDYMSPEQIRGEDLDSRTDVFALGLLLYEMAEARRPFAAGGRDHMYAALQEEPAPFGGPIEPSFEWLVKSCLAKDREARMQSAHDVMLELKRMASSDSTGSSRTTRRAAAIWPWVIAAASLVGLFLVAFWNPPRREYDQPIRRFSILPPEGAPLAAGLDVESFAISPDGQQIAYVSATDPPELLLYSLESQSVTRLPGTSGANSPFFSSDGEWIGFGTAAGELKKLSLDGGVLIPLADGLSLRGAAWRGDRIVFAEPWMPLQTISSDGGKPAPVSSSDPGIAMRWPSFLPDGEHVLYAQNEFAGDYEQASIAIHSLRTGRGEVIVRGGTRGRYVPTGHLTYFHSGTVFAVPFDATSRRVTGKPIPLLSNVEGDYATGIAQYAVAQDGTLFYVAASEHDAQSELVSVSRNGAVNRLSSVQRAYDEPRWAPDGKRLVVTVGRGPRSDLWLYDTERDGWRRLTAGGRNTSGVWSPDGSRIVFASNRNRGFALFMMTVGAPDPPAPIRTASKWVFPTSWSSDGRSIAIDDQYRRSHSDVHVLHSPWKESVPLLTTTANEHAAMFSPDGDWMAYESDESGRFEVYVRHRNGPGSLIQVSTAGGAQPVWRGDGRELFYRSGERMMSVRFENGAASRPEVVFSGKYEAAYDVSPDGQRFLMVRRAPAARRPPIEVVFGLLKRADDE